MDHPTEIALPMSSQSESLSDRQVFADLVRRHAAGLLGLATRLTADRAEAEDLVQETFLKAWRGIARFRRESKVRTWLTRILINTAHDERRKRRPAARFIPDRPGPGAHPADGMARRDLLHRVLDAVSGLPRRQRETLVLRARGGLSHKEIADILGIRPGVVKLHLVHARKSLFRRFGREVSEWGIE
jgi:RNA polymerase sigma-70 factor (ECF subfamily)